MTEEAQQELKAAGIEEEIKSELADAGYWSEGNVAKSSPAAPEFLIATTKDWKQRKAMRPTQQLAILIYYLSTVFYFHFSLYMPCLA